MNELNPTSKPSSAGARITGDDVQHLVALYWCLRAVADPETVTSVGVETDGVGNVDDVTVTFADGTQAYIQVKATVSAAKPANLDWLKEQPAPSPKTGYQKPSILQALHRSWIDLDRPSDGLELITGRPIDSSDKVMKLLDRKNSIGPALRRGDSRAAKTARLELADHLSCDEAEVCDLFDALTIRPGQTEGEWRSRVIDLALAAGMRSDGPAIATALNWVREWVKDTRDPRSVQMISDQMAILELRVEEPRAVVVVQGLAPLPTDDAKYVLDWTHLFRGDSPATRRGLIDTDDWNGALSSDLEGLADELRAAQINRILLRGSLRLPCWFAVGAALRGVSGFEIAVDDRGRLWSAEQGSIASRQVEVLADQEIGDGERTVVVVAIATDQTADVREHLVSDVHHRLITLTIAGGPSQSLLSNGADALSAASAIREWIRTNVRGVEIDLVLMTSAPFAAFLGSLWDRMPTTTLHEDLIDGYELAFILSNTGLSSPTP